MTWGPHWVWDTCPDCHAPPGQPCRDLRTRDRRPMPVTIHRYRPAYRVDRPEDMPR